MHLVKVRGERARPNGRTRYWNVLLPKANLRNFLWEGMMETWKYASFRSIVTNQSSYLIWLTMIGIVNILNLNLLRERFKCRRSKIGRNPPHPSWELWNTGCRNRTPCLAEEHVLWPLSPTESFLFHYQTLLQVHYSPDHPIKLWGANRTAVCTPFYCTQDPWRYIWKALPCVDIIY